MIVKNEDYKKGVKFLLEKCREKKINIHKFYWVTDLSFLLSLFGGCYKFWNNVYEQDKLGKIQYCTTLYDIFYDDDTLLFQWELTQEGGTYWSLLLIRDLFPFKDRYTKLVDIRFLHG